MSKITLQTLIENAGLEPYSYSGRAMYGKTCLAVNLDNGLGEFISAIMTEALENADNDDIFDVARAFESMRTDSMGRGIVVYFPGVPFEGDDSEDDEDEDDEDDSVEA
jgi:hypothetical protein